MQIRLAHAKGVANAFVNLALTNPSFPQLPTPADWSLGRGTRIIFTLTHAGELTVMFQDHHCGDSPLPENAPTATPTELDKPLE
jgi:hypothetical protein